MEAIATFIGHNGRTVVDIIEEQVASFGSVFFLRIYKDGELKETTAHYYDKDMAADFAAFYTEGEYDDDNKDLRVITDKQCQLERKII